MFHLISLLLVLLISGISLVSAAETCAVWAAKITSMHGTVEIRKQSTEWVPASFNDNLCENDSFRTAEKSRATIQLQDETFMVLDERTSIKITGDLRAKTGVLPSLLKLFSGEALFRSRRPREFGIETPFVNAMHEGTEFLVKVNEDSAQVVVFDGLVVASNTLGQVRIKEGQSAVAEKGQAPMIGPRIDLRDAVQWTLYYPPVIDYTASVKLASYPILKPVLDRFHANDLSAAFEQLDKVSESERNADYHILNASLLLTVGRVELARQSLAKVMQDSGQNVSALALQSIIALAKSDQQQALKLAQQAQQLNPKAPAPNIALSYVYQSLFDIEKALDSATQAAQSSPENGLAWARVSEMELATGNVDASMDAASKAQTLNPQLAKTNTVLGFARLATLDLGDAEQSFRTAIKSDPSDPLARLGLGLAKIRQGHIKSGTKEMETAANLDPDNALIRSYLGKAYYEQRRGSIASTEYAIAKKLDPNDPTPWFYDAIYKQTVNRPVEALHDMQKAIELNGNRAVFRSKLLLDQDLAARSASLGRIYNDLGFQQRGLLEGWKAVNTDLSNYSAHRLLADNYAALPRHEIARVSELLQSQLLQPINITPIQPELAESNLLILDGLGTADSSFNEFNPLFARNRLALQASGTYGSNNTWGEEVTQSGLWNNISYSLGQLHYNTDGFRDNNDLKQDIYSGFIQAQITPSLNIQTEVRYNDINRGDLIVNFDPSDFSRDKRFVSRNHSVRFGARFSPSSNQDVILSYIYRDHLFRDTRKFDDSFPEFDFFSTGKEITKLKNDAHNGELQYQLRSLVADFVFGIGYFSQNERITNKIDKIEQLLPDPPEETHTENSINRDSKHLNAYIYSNVNIYKNLIANLGLSFASFDSKSLGEIQRFSPKAGLTWNISPDTTLRGAWFQTIKRPLASNQTIEPTQIAGFNQFYDDLNGSNIKRYGVAIDQVFSSSLYGGLELSWRSLDIPVSRNLWTDQDERIHRAYLYWTPAKFLSLSTEYQYERIKREPTTSSDPLIVKSLTHRLPITIKIFIPNGLFGKLEATYIHQNLTLPNKIVKSDKDQHWILNTSFGYRLPKRFGILSFGVNNILNKKNIKREIFQFDTGSGKPLVPQFQPELTFFTRITLSF